MSTNFVFLPNREYPRDTQKIFPASCTWAGSKLALFLWGSLRADSGNVTGKLQFQKPEDAGHREHIYKILSHWYFLK